MPRAGRWRGGGHGERHRPVPHPANVLHQLAELPAKTVGLLAKLRHRTLVAEEVLELVVELEGGVGLLAEGTHLLAKALNPIGLLLGGVEAGGELFEPRELLFGGYASFPEGVHLGRAVEQRGERSELRRGGFGADHQRIKRGGCVGAIGVLEGDRRVAVVAATAFQERHHLVLRNDAGV